MLWQWFTDPDPVVNMQAYTGSLLLLVVTALTVLCAALLARLFRTIRRLAESGSRRTGERTSRGSVSAMLGALWILGALGVIAILLRSVTGAWRFPNILPSGDGVFAWLSALSVTGGATATTVVLAASTALVSVALVLPAAERLHDNAPARRHVGLVLFLPLLLPQMTFLFGVQIVLAAMRMDGTFVAVLWSHLIFALPYVWGLLAAARGAIDPRYRDIARTLGASPVRVWIQATAPLLLRSGILALALAFSVSVALYLPTLFAGAGRIATVATEVAAAAGSGTLHLAAMHALPLTLLPLLAFALAYTAHALVFRRHRGVPG
jgi:putative thiamine transport system permease protein